MLVVNHRDVFSGGRKVGSDATEYAQVNLNGGVKIDLIQEFRQLVGFKLYDTRSHVEVYQLLYAQAENLCNGNYVNTQGVCSSTMVGAKGIGKTFSMKVFATVAPQFFPSLITVYVSLNNVLALGSPFAEHSLMTVLNDELEHYGAKSMDYKGQLGERIVESLAATGQYVHLLVDELDQLYKANGEQNTLAIQTLHDLSYLGNQPSGRIAVVVCGSSSLMENLITTNATPQIKGEFPLLSTGAINLNGTKFVTKRVHSTLPNDLSAVASIAGVDNDDVHRQYLRAIAYLSGCSARKVDRVIRDGNNWNSQLGANSPENSLSGSNTLGNDEIGRLQRKIYAGLYKKNKELCDSLFVHDDPEVAATSIGLIAWEEQLQPLSYEEVEKIWMKMVKYEHVSKENKGNLNYNVLHLADRNWITIDGIVRSRPNAVYPYSLSALVAYGKNSVNHKQLQDMVYKLVAKGAGAGGRLVLDPKLVAVVVATAPCWIAFCTIS